MGLTKLALKRPVSCIMLVLALMVFGISSIFSFKMELTPDIELPVLAVLTQYPGADPESVEELVTTKIEDAGETLTGVRLINSRSAENISMVVFMFEYGVDIQKSHDDLRAALETASMNLPSDAKSPTIIEMNMNSMPIMRISAIEVGDIDLATVIEEDVVKKLETVQGIAEVSTTGGRTRYIQIRLRPEMMKQYGLTMSALSGVLKAADFSYPAGSVDQGDQAVAVTAGQDFNTVQLLKNLPIATPKGQTLMLSEVADIIDAEQEATSIARYDGRDNVQISITKNQSYGTVNVANDVRKKLEEIRTENPAIQFDVTYDSSESIINSLKSVGETLIIGVVLSMAVLFIFFGDIKASLIVGSSMPISLFVTVILMSMAGFSLNVVTLGALVIAIGMMVDNSIVVVESCFRAREQGCDFRKAAEDGTREVTASIVASTITTIVVYLPLATMSGMSGQMFTQLGWTIVFAMTASLISAMTLVPLFYNLFKPKEKTDIPSNRLLEKFRSVYEPFLHTLLHRKVVVVLATIAALVISVLAATTLNVEMMPQADEGVVDVSVSFRSGTNLEAKNRVMTELEKLAMEDPDVSHVTLSVGGGSMLTSSATASLSLKLDKTRCETDDKVEDWINKTADLTGVDINVSAGGSGNGSMSSSGASKDIELQGYDHNLVKSETLRLQAELRKLPGIVNVHSEAQESSTQAKVVVDPLKSMSYGLTPVQVATELSHVIGGLEACKVQYQGDEYSVKLEYPKGLYDNLNALLDVELSTAAGSSVPLRDIAAIKYVDAMETLTRLDGFSDIALTCYMLPSTRFETEKAIEAFVADFDFAEGVKPIKSVQDDMMGDEISNLVKAILTAVFLVFLVMAMQFESPKFSLMVMLCIPFALIGSFLFMAAVRATISMVSLMGFLMLMGIVVNNGILFVDTANSLRTEIELEDALVKAASIRIRPILMTTLTTILSMIPLGIGAGENGQMMQGMALVIIGGLLASTVLTLLVLPDFYLIMDRMTAFLRHRKENKMDDEVMY